MTLSRFSEIRGIEREGVLLGYNIRIRRSLVLPPEGTVMVFRAKKESVEGERCRGKC